MRLNNPLASSFVYNDMEYEIDLSFDNVLDVFDVLADESLREYEKSEIAVTLLLDQSFSREESIEMWNLIYKEFIHIEKKQPLEFDLKGNPMPQKEENNKKLIDFNKDAEYIVASFRQAYNMDLHKEHGKLHWHVFQSLLSGLPTNTIMQRVIQIRLWEPSKGESGEYKQKMRDLQKVYALEEESMEEDPS